MPNFKESEVSIRRTAKQILRLGATAVLRPWLAATGRQGTWPPPREPRRLVVLAAHWIGDSFWALQAIRALADAWPGTEVHVAVKPQSVFLFRDFGAERIWPAPELVSDRHREPISLSGIRRRAAVVRGDGVDAVVDLTGNRFSAWFSLLLRADWSLGLFGDELAAVYTHRVDPSPGVHLGRRPLEVVAPLIGPRTLPDVLALPTPRPDLAAALRTRRGLGRAETLAVVAPGAGWAAKRWDPERFAETARLLAARGRTVLVVGGPGDRELCARVVDGAGDGVLNLAGEPLDQLVELLREKIPMLTNDSGPGHIAAGVGCPTVMVFRDTDPSEAFPLGPRARCFEAHRDPMPPEAIAEWLLPS